MSIKLDRRGSEGANADSTKLFCNYYLVALGNILFEDRQMAHILQDERAWIYSALTISALWCWFVGFHGFFLRDGICRYARMNDGFLGVSSWFFGTLAPSGATNVALAVSRRPEEQYRRL